MAIVIKEPELGVGSIDSTYREFYAVLRAVYNPLKMEMKISRNGRVKKVYSTWVNSVYRDLVFALDTGISALSVDENDPRADILILEGNDPNEDITQTLLPYSEFKYFGGPELIYYPLGSAEIWRVPWGGFKCQLVKKRFVGESFFGKKEVIEEEDVEIYPGDKVCFLFGDYDNKLEGIQFLGIFPKAEIDKILE